MDYTVGDTLYFMFTTRRFTTGAPHQLAGTPVVSAYEDDSTTQITAGITLGVDHDGVTGLNLLTVVATGGNGFEAGKQYNLVITTGTVDSVSVVGEVVATFSLGAEAAFTRLGAPAGASIAADIATLDDFVDTEVAAIKTKTDQLTFSTANRVDSQVFGMENGTVTAAAVATGAIDADAIADNAIDAGAIAADAIGASELAADAANEIADALLDRAAGVETGLTLRQWLRLGASALFGKASGLATTTAVYRDFGDSKDRITATVDGDGNRTAITYDAT